MVFLVLDSGDEGNNSRNFLRSQFDYRQSMFYVELPDGTILSHIVEETETFPAQFGREVIDSVHFSGLIGSIGGLNSIFCLK